GTARAPRATGTVRPGSARHRASARRRRITLGVAGVVLAAAVGAGAWYATSGDEGDPDKPGTGTSAPPRP
ncbi:serine/threonine protein kinase, partial [Streptomyces sp. LNU-CPARS28]